ncbi:hypothetical protein [Paraburkholderia unamae]|uniref:PXPV repeat-containing protein n=1 Tax=Paraburkholderia unamae TaxID=219649 RepID=A0ABX5KFY7_9BURK|nr:hypothetical protein [Paraburkholderia unamae]PVX71996.1 hypothetical protein C7402_12643 [Paraburkholderia unamae]RAR52433.1 hypothetical protein C7401_13241 [Paraburkholderia unamae]
MKCPSVPVIAAACSLLTLSGCYYYYPYGYGPYYTGVVPAANTQQETAVMQTAPNPAPAAVADAQYPGPLYPSPPVAIAAPAWPAYPAYAAYPAYPAYQAYPAYSAYPAYYPYPAYGWGWGAPAISFGFGYWGGGGGHWHH